MSTMSGSLLFRVSVPSQPEFVQVLTDILTDLKVKHPTWIDGKEEGTNLSYKQVLFYMENGPETEEAIRLLTDNDIGVTPNSSIGLFQCYLLYQGSREASPRIKVTSPKDEDGWEGFLESVRPRLAIAQIVESVKRKASFTFDFLVLLIVAALIAALGLVEDSQLVLAASVLISPMMFPMVATTFGTVIGQWKLQKLGMRNGLLGLLVCLIIGFLFGFPASLIHLYWTDNVWPTSLMYSMGTVRSLWTGAFLALLSGTAVSILILGEEPGSINGEAISAAFLPPAVNAGLLWSRSVLVLVTGAPRLHDRSRPPGQVWSEDPPTELALLGTISLTLAFLSVIFIFIAGNLLLKVKEVASRRLRRDSRFHNLKKYKPFTKEEADHITVRFGKELRIHHWTVSPNDFHGTKLPRGLETWSGSCRTDDSRPTAQYLAHLLAPPHPRQLAHPPNDSDYAQSCGSSTQLLTPPSRGASQHYDTSLSPPSSRFTVIPVTPTPNDLLC